ncbi:MarR family transcriptional regulator [Sphingomonas sp. MMSM20]|uniref:MarR family winged helix-turn-helix transcriptional regulator n=1 Tax=Sphingomonas lycopersici TaxID=2951807 RepID=UPI0022381496|nr:MarR family transcriptional regulator [Sphingomonas lycopersici]MCW6531402.1 MarR family transcriptional regulator [Sphingomonas lycopersici]
MNCDDQLIQGLARVYLHLQRRVNRELAQEGGSLARLKLLLFVQKREGAARAADIADMFDLAPRTVTEGLDALERDGLIVRTADSDDRRVKRIAVTPAGEGVIAASQPLRAQLLAETFAVLTAEERAQLSALLGKLAASLDEG